VPGKAKSLGLTTWDSKKSEVRNVGSPNSFTPEIMERH